MLERRQRLFCLTAAFATTAFAATVSADFADDFSSYADQAAFDAQYTTGFFGVNGQFGFIPDFTEVAFNAADDNVKLSVEHSLFALINITRNGSDTPLGNGLKLSVNVSDFAQGDNLTGVQLTLAGIDSGNGAGSIFAEIDPIDFDYDGNNVDGFAIRSLQFRDEGGATILDTNFPAVILGTDLRQNDFSLVVDGTNYEVFFGNTSLTGGPQAHGLGADPLLAMSKEFAGKIELIRVGGSPDPVDEPQLARKMMVVNSFSLTSVPEPASLALLGLGGLTLLRRHA